MRRIYAASSGAIAAGASSTQPVMVQFASKGQIVGVSVSTKVDSDAERGGMMVGIRIGPSDELVRDGQGSSSKVPLASLCPKNAPVFPLVRVVKQDTQAYLTFTNAHSSDTITANVAFIVDEDE